MYMVVDREIESEQTNLAAVHQGRCLGERHLERCKLPLMRLNRKFPFLNTVLGLHDETFLVSDLKLSLSHGPP